MYIEAVADMLNWFRYTVHRHIYILVHNVFKLLFHVFHIYRHMMSHFSTRSNILARVFFTCSTYRRHMMSDFSTCSNIFARVFFTRNMVSRAAGFWYQHSLIKRDAWCRTCKQQRQECNTGTSTLSLNVDAWCRTCKQQRQECNTGTNTLSLNAMLGVEPANNKDKNVTWVPTLSH